MRDAVRPHAASVGTDAEARCSRLQARGRQEDRRQASAGRRGARAHRQRMAAEETR